MRILTSGLSLFYLANGLFMLFLPRLWYELTPGVVEHGAFNGHFVRDVGIAFAAAAAGILLTLFPQRRWSAGAAAAVAFIGGHALLHLVELVHGGDGGAFLRDGMLILLPALLVGVWFYRHTQEVTS